MSFIWTNCKPRLLIAGYGEHGKGKSIKILNRLYGLTGISSSMFANETIVYPLLKNKYGYQSLEECFNDRYNHREEWYKAIKDYNTPDGCKLARQLYSQFDIYDGVRNIEEFEAMRDSGLFNLSIWIDASKRKPIEDKSSCTVKPSDMNIILDNNDKLYITTRNLIKLLLGIYPSLK